MRSRSNSRSRRKWAAAAARRTTRVRLAGARGDGGDDGRRVVRRAEVRRGPPVAQVAHGPARGVHARRRRRLDATASPASVPVVGEDLPARVDDLRAGDEAHVARTSRPGSPRPRRSGSPAPGPGRTGRSGASSGRRRAPAPGWCATPATPTCTPRSRAPSTRQGPRRLGERLVVADHHARSGRPECRTRRSGRPRRTRCSRRAAGGPCGGDRARRRRSRTTALLYGRSPDAASPRSQKPAVTTMSPASAVSRRISGPSTSSAGGPSSGVAVAGRRGSRRGAASGSASSVDALRPRPRRSASRSARSPRPGRGRSRRPRRRTSSRSRVAPFAGPGAAQSGDAAGDGLGDLAVGPAQRDPAGRSPVRSSPHTALVRRARAAAAAAPGASAVSIAKPGKQVSQSPTVAPAGRGTAATSSTAPAPAGLGEHAERPDDPGHRDVLGRRGPVRRVRPDRRDHRAQLGGRARATWSPTGDRCSPGASRRRGRRSAGPACPGRPPPAGTGRGGAAERGDRQRGGHAELGVPAEHRHAVGLGGARAAR